MSTQQRIWIDMTDLGVWSGHMTGVQRVVYQTALRYIESPAHDAHCFMFDDVRNVFVEVNFADIRSQVEAALTEASGRAAERPRTLLQRAKRVPRALVRRMPASVKQKVPSVVKQGLKKSYHKGTAVLRAGKQALDRRRALSNAANAPAPIVFTERDVVVVLGKSWDMPALIPTLGRLKQEQHFKLVHLIHDMIPTLEPHLFGHGLFEPYTKCMFEVCSLSDAILANSESTKRDVLRFCAMTAIPTPHVTVVRLGDDLLEMPLASDMPAPDPRIKKGEFILQVGTIELRKNHLLTYLAYREAALRGVELPMWVIMGSQGWMVGDLVHQIEHDPVVKDKVIILRGRPDSERLWLFKNCMFTVFPSTYEGWGMPLSEGLAYGKVSITSTTASLPEIGGTYADYVSPYNSQEMLEAIIKYTDPKVRTAREKEIQKGYKLTSWDQTFKQIDRSVQALKG